MPADHGHRTSATQPQPHSASQARSAAARLERLPLGSFHRHFIVRISLGCWFDVFDIFMMAYLGAALTVFIYWFSAVLHAYQAALFPTRARATGVGFTYRWGRLSVVCSTLIIGALLARSADAVFLFMAASMTGVAMVVGIWGPRMNAVALEEVSQ
ncbi:MAG TPA: hypothetical protein VL523_14855 [Terriglobia bacterium]|nr:hypothetical protein [Terriglobia bacterium]